MTPVAGRHRDKEMKRFPVGGDGLVPVIKCLQRGVNDGRDEEPSLLDAVTHSCHD
jgi:hypothetical protein